MSAKETRENGKSADREVGIFAMMKNRRRDAGVPEI